jgi:hypothetical protein
MNFINVNFSSKIAHDRLFRTPVSLITRSTDFSTAVLSAQSQSSAQSSGWQTYFLAPNPEHKSQLNPDIYTAL